MERRRLLHHFDSARARPLAQTYDLLEKFRAEHPDIKVSRGVWQAHKPFYIVRGKQTTCTCRYCENLRLMIKALHENRRLFKCIANTPEQTSRWAQIIQRWYRRWGGRAEEQSPFDNFQLRRVVSDSTFDEKLRGRYFIE